MLEQLKTFVDKRKLLTMAKPSGKWSFEELCSEQCERLHILAVITDCELLTPLFTGRDHRA